MLALVFGFLAVQLMALFGLAATAPAVPTDATTTPQPKRKRRGSTPQLDPTTAHQRDGTTRSQSGDITRHGTHETTAHQRTGRTRGTPHGHGHTRTSTHLHHDDTDDVIRKILGASSIGSDTIRGSATPVLAAA